MALSSKPVPQSTHSLTTTEAAVLALLAINGEQSGYDLLKAANASIGYLWAPAKSQLYAVLPRLVKEGTARRRRIVQERRPDKQLYGITKEGRRRLQTWLETIEPGAFDAFYLRLFVGGLSRPDVLLAHIEQFKEDVEGQLAEYRAVEQRNTRRGHDLFHHFLLRLGIDRAELSLRWAHETLAELRKATG